MATERLDRGRVIAAAVTLLDAEGLDALSTRRLGTALNSSANAMYWHVGNMHNLVGLATNAVFAELELDPRGTSWRDRLAATARELRGLFTRHHWLTAAFSGNSRIHGPEIVRFQDHLLQVCQQAGFEGFDLDWAGAAVFSYVIGDVWGQSPAPHAATPVDSTADLVEQAKADLADYPLLLERYTALAETDPGVANEASFEFGLCTLLDGLQAHLDHVGVLDS
ncbi:MAG: TetR/AcrR family transcriptional regulator C-terminal domain-containing protein [Propionibacteriales bacterium]|nr:TetR/AcrR family transcriptional regulator C-terminal domain-containing protein [Propionibacteriales bacterium]